jgi:hypothetical protein
MSTDFSSLQTQVVERIERIFRCLDIFYLTAVTVVFNFTFKILCYSTYPLLNIYSFWNINVTCLYTQLWTYRHEIQKKLVISLCQYILGLC